MLDLNALYEVVVYTLGDTKAGSKMGKLQLRNTNDDSLLNCIMWEETVMRLDEKLFRTGNIVKILTGTFNEKFNNCLISDLQLIKEAKTGLDKDVEDKMYSEIIDTVKSFKNKKLSEFVSTLLSENEHSFRVSPAAKLMHHNYSGGLLQHTYECMNIAKNVVDMFPSKLEKDEVVAASILHDFAKIFEYVINEKSGLIDYDESFYDKWISHSQWGFSKCMNAGFPRVAKMIAAHHGRTDWGSIIDLNQRDLEPYVYVLHHIDDLSAKFGKTSVSEL